MTEQQQQNEDCTTLYLKTGGDALAKSTDTERLMAARGWGKGKGE